MGINFFADYYLSTIPELHFISKLQQFKCISNNKSGWEGMIKMHFRHLLSLLISHSCLISKKDDGMSAILLHFL